MPDWMKGQESGLENLQMDLLEAPEQGEGGADDSPMPDALEPEEPEVDDSEGDEGSSRMIDLPFRLFDD